MADFRELDRRCRELGMSRATLAKRSGISLPTVHRILSGKEKSPALPTVEALAAALGMQLQLTEVVAAETLREQQAQSRARMQIRLLQGAMGLESQAVDDATLESLVKQNVHRLLAGTPRRLWNE